MRLWRLKCRNVHSLCKHLHPRENRVQKFAQTYASSEGNFVVSLSSRSLIENEIIGKPLLWWMTYRRIEQNDHQPWITTAFAALNGRSVVRNTV